MFREMRREKQLLSDDAARHVLEKGTTGVLGVAGDNGYPYTVPLNYVFTGEAIYFHCAKAGHKLDAIRACDKVSFCVIDKAKIAPEEFTTYFTSVVVFGRATEVTDDDEKLIAMRLLNEKYVPGRSDDGEAEVQRAWNVLNVVKIVIEHLTGKEAVELVKQNKSDEQ